jgi:aspartate ammonia-lyase
MSDLRIETDMIGEVELPRAALFGIHTARALANFGTRSVRMSDRPQFLAALAHVKAAAAEANCSLGNLEPTVKDAIVGAANEVIAGDHIDQFPLALVQGGGGTSANMAINEVLANRAAQILGAEVGVYDVVHPLDHVNRSQSTNDVLPTAIAIAVVSVAPEVDASLRLVADVLSELATRAGERVRLGRTCLQDALPLPIRDYHAAQSRAVQRSAAALRHSVDPLHEVALGATAVGTGFGAPVGYRELAVSFLVERTGLPLRPSPDLIDALAHLDPALRAAQQLAAAAIALAKIAADLRLLSSGPVGGIGEIRLTPVQAGSSIMPGKVNPVIAELVVQTSFEIRASAHAIELAAAAGEPDLNVWEMIVARHLPDALAQLGEVAALFARRCLKGLEWNDDAVQRHLRGSLAPAVKRALLAGHADEPRMLPS